MRETLDITGWLTSIVGTDGTSLLIVMVIVTFLDAFLIPTIPEIFFMTILSYDPSSPQWIFTILLVTMLGEALGILALWFFTSRFTIPNWIKKAVGTYVDYLIVPNEKMVLVNRFAPMLPFTGAFAAIMSWDIRKVLAFNAAGCLIKYGFLAILGGSLYAILGENAGLATILVTIVVMVIGISLGIRRKNRRKAELESEAQNEDY